MHSQMFWQKNLTFVKIFRQVLHFFVEDALKMVIDGCSAKRATVEQLKQQLGEVEKDLTSRLQTIDSNCSRMTVCSLLDCPVLHC